MSENNDIGIELAKRKKSIDTRETTSETDSDNDILDINVCSDSDDCIMTEILGKSTNKSSKKTKIAKKLRNKKLKLKKSSQATSTKKNEAKNSNNELENLNESIGQQQLGSFQYLSMPCSSAILHEDLYLTVPSFAQNVSQIEDPFSHLFKNVCRRSMYFNCSKNPSKCDFDHCLPVSFLFRKKLDEIGLESGVKVYDTFIIRNQNLFQTYFDDFVDFFVKNHLNDKLCEMVNDCIIRRKEFLINKIITGLVNSGCSFTESLKLLVKKIKYKTKNTSRVLVKLIFDHRNRDIGPYLQILTELSQENYCFSPKAINHMLMIYNETKNEELSPILSNIIKTRSFDPLINNDLLKEFTKN